MADLGEPERWIEIEPAPVPEQAPVREPSPEPTRDPELVPA